MRWLMGALAGAALCSCSFLYSPNNLPESLDAPVDAPVPADPTRPMLLGISPTIIYEGQGDAGSAPALLVIRGANLVNANLVVTLVTPGGKTVRLEPVTDAVASANNRYVAFTVKAPVDGTLQSDVPLDVTIAQDVPVESGGGRATSPPLSGKLVLRGLRELAATAPMTITTPLAEDRYSKVDLSMVTFRGPMPAVVRAVSSIVVGSAIADAATTTPGPGGIPGSLSAGACPTPSGGGGLGGNATLVALLSQGGGGGGAGGVDLGTGGTTGMAGLGGVGGTGGSPGLRSGGDPMASFTDNAACAGGGGGIGGTLVLLGTPGAGGAGGGTLALIAGGDLRAASLSARGGGGSPGTAGGAGGGGGAGGNILVRTDSGTLTLTAVTVAAGPGASPNGAPGSVGRVRWDGPGEPPGVSARRGLAFAALATRVFTMSSPSLTVLGTSGDGFAVRVIDEDNQSRSGGTTSVNNGEVVIIPELQPGHNQVCVTLDGGAQGSLEADKCIDLAFLP